MKRRQFLGMLMLTGALGLITSGCGSDDKEVKVTGSVTKGGKAQEAVNVGFTPSDPKQGTAKGTRTNAEGQFEVLLPPGQYTVVLTKMVDKKGNVPKESDNPAEDYTQLEASGYLRPAFPAKYANPDSSPFKVEISSENKELPPFDVK